MSVFIALNGLPAAIIRVSRETCVRLPERRSVDLGATFLRLVVTPTTPLSAAARHYVSTNLSASAIEEVEAGVAELRGFSGAAAGATYRCPSRPRRGRARTA